MLCKAIKLALDLAIHLDASPSIIAKLREAHDEHCGGVTAQDGGTGQDGPPGGNPNP